jgi:outer membrane protein assembly factor BamB
MNLHRHAFLAFLLTLTLITLSASADNWPRFRGPNGTGIADDKNIPVEWTEKNILWKCELPGVGHSSPIVWGDRIFLQTASKDGKDRRMVCVSADSGTVLWSTPVSAAKAGTHQKNSLASGTPATDGKQVYAIFWDGKDLEAVAFDFDGKLVWIKDQGSFTSQHGAGHSPIVVDGTVIFANDQDGSAKIVALDAKDGSEVWTKDRTPHRACYSTPFLRDRTDGSTELIVTSSSGITAYNPKNGESSWEYVWSFDGRPLRTVASSIFSDGMVFACSGDGDGSRCAIAIKADGKGSVTKNALVWENKKSLPYVPSLLARGEHIFSVNDRGLAGCFTAKTGEEVWTKQLQGGDVSASPIMVDGKIYTINEKGDVYVFAAENKFKQLAKNSIGEPVTATPAVADGKMFIRGRDHLFCIGTPKN